MSMKTVMILTLSLLQLSQSFEVSGLTLSGPESAIILNQPDHLFKISLESSNLQIANCLSYEVSENVYLSLSDLTGSSLEIDENLSFDGVPQWKLAQIEDFTKPKGWSDNRNSRCGSTIMLGGYCQFSNNEVTKTFTDLPRHSSVKIVASFHFIDAWIGETGYMKVFLEGTSQYVWTENYKAGQAGNGVSACGEYHAEGKYVSNIEVILPHSENNLVVSIGATLDEDPCDESWGVSVFQIYVR